MPRWTEQRRKEYQRRYHKDYDRLRYEQKRQELIAWLGGACVVCNSDEDLQFDHVDPVKKELNISHVINRPLAQLKLELSKCQLLCRECHVKKHAPKHGERGMYKKGCRCKSCREAHNNYMREWKRQQRETLRAKGLIGPPRRRAP